MRDRRKIISAVALVAAWVMLGATPAVAGTATKTAPYSSSDADTWCFYPDRGTCELLARADRNTGQAEVHAGRGAQALDWGQGGIAQAQGRISDYFRTSKGTTKVRAIVTLQVHAANAELRSDLSSDRAALWATATIETKSGGEWLYFSSGSKIVDTDAGTAEPSSYSGLVVISVETAFDSGRSIDNGAHLHLYLSSQARLSFPGWQPSLIDRSASAAGSITVTSIQFTSS